MANIQRGSVHDQQARVLYISNETIDMFLKTAPLAQVGGICYMIVYSQDPIDIICIGNSTFSAEQLTCRFIPLSCPASAQHPCAGSYR